MFDSRKHLYSFLMFLFSLFVLYSLQQTYLSNSLLKFFDSFWLSFSDKKTRGTCSFVSFIVKTILLEIASSLSTPATEKMICPFKFQLSFAINQYISSDLQKLLRYVNDTAIAVFFEVPFAPSATVFHNDLALYLKDLKTLPSTISALKSVALPL